MGLFDIFKKNKKFDLPDSYKGIINKNDYNLVIDIAKKYHFEKELPITQINEGEIITEIDGEEQHRYLDNLVRLLSSNDKELWEYLINEHFEKTERK